jgi:hypothetical protein
VTGRYSSETAWRRTRQVVRGANPAAGADPSLTVEAGHLYRLLAVYAELVTDATAANRTPRLTISDGASVFLSIPPASSVPASTTARLAWIVGAAGYSSGDGQVMPLPELELQAGWQLALVTGAIQAADDYGALAAVILDTTARGGAVDLVDLPDLRVEVVGGLTT